MEIKIRHKKSAYSPIQGFSVGRVLAKVVENVSKIIDSLQINIWNQLQSFTNFFNVWVTQTWGLSFYNWTTYANLKGFFFKFICDSNRKFNSFSLICKKQKNSKKFLSNLDKRNNNNEEESFHFWFFHVHTFQKHYTNCKCFQSDGSHKYLLQ